MKKKFLMTVLLFLAACIVLYGILSVFAANRSGPPACIFSGLSDPGEILEEMHP